MPKDPARADLVRAKGVVESSRGSVAVRSRLTRASRRGVGGRLVLGEEVAQYRRYPLRVTAVVRGGVARTAQDDPPGAGEDTAQAIQ